MCLVFKDILKPGEKVDYYVHKKEDEDAGEENRNYGF
jgi:hypothetical protein